MKPSMRNCIVFVCSFISVFVFIARAGLTGDTASYVATNGNDGNPGTMDMPWRTIQKAAATVSAGMHVYVRGGVYNEAVTVSVSGSLSLGSIVFQPYPGEQVAVDGTGLVVPSASSGLFLIVDRSYIVVKGFEIRNYKTSTKGRVPVGIYVTGTSHHIEIRNNSIHAIEQNGTSSSGTDAHGIAVYGTSAAQSINNIVIDGNELFNLKLGSSESLVLNGNVDTFQVTNNVVHNNNNIGIDAIGFEGTSPDTTTDQARHGLISGNVVYKIDSYGNVAYGTDRSADGIYVDGGRDIVIERNIVHHCNIGIELASEHAGRATSGITMRNNFIYRNDIAGVAIGGYDTKRGSTQSCSIVNNTLCQNDTLQDGNGELYVQFDTRNNVIKNNIIIANQQNVFITNAYAQNTGNLVDHNLYFSPGGSTSGTWEWKKTTYSDFSQYRTATGNDAYSIFADPLIVSSTAPDLHLKTGSPAVDAGEALSQSGTIDIDGNPRIRNLIDIGAEEFNNSVTFIAETRRDIPDRFHLTAYPNPFNPSTTIHFTVGERCRVSLQVYDVIGRLIATLVDEEKSAGVYAVPWNPSNQPTGVYFCRLAAGEKSQGQKLILMK